MTEPTLAPTRRAGTVLAALAALMALMAPAVASTASYAAPALRAEVSAGSQAAGASTRVSVAVRPAGALTRATLEVALPEGWPSLTRGSVRLDTDDCRSGAARWTSHGLVVSRLTCRAGASIEVSAAGRLPAKAGRYQLATSISDARGSRTTRPWFTVEPATAHHLVLSPPSATITYGETRTFRAYAEDAFGNRREEVTDRASFALGSGGTCAGSVCGTGAHAGDHLVTGSLDGLSGYADLVVAPRHVTVSATPVSRGYGATDPVFAYTVDGLVGPATDLAGVTCGVAGAHAAVGDYPVTCAGATDRDYVVDRYVPATLRVRPAPLTVRVSGAQTYGFAASYAVDQVSGLVNGDTTAVVRGTLSCQTSATPGSGVGTYPITGCTGLMAANYTVGYTYGSVRVTPLAVTVRADAKTKGAGQPDPAFTYTTVPAGLRLAGVACSVSPAHSAEGVYPITCSTTTDPNYAQTSVPGTLTVTSTPLVVRVTGTQTYGGTPAYVSTITSGLVNGDTAAVLHGSLSCQTAATGTSAVGAYAISGCSGLSATGYTISYDYGSLQVTRAPLRVRVSGTQPYGGSPAFTADVVAADLVGHDTAAVVSGTLDCDTTATAASAPGAYPISQCRGLSAANYALAYTYGSLTVAPPPAVCGNAVQETGEACDDGNVVTETGSCPYGQATCVPACSAACDAVITLPAGGACGDGVTQAAEACDDGNTTTETSCPYGQATCNACNASCTGVLPLTGGYCGDNTKQAGEACDDGNTDSESSCPYGMASCVTCNGTCTVPLILTGTFCGDGKVTDAEVCDDGDLGGGACNATCTGPT